MSKGGYMAGEGDPGRSGASSQKPRAIGTTYDGGTLVEVATAGEVSESLNPLFVDLADFLLMNDVNMIVVHNRPDEDSQYVIVR